MLSQETFSLFCKHVRRQNLLKYDIKKFKNFLEDNIFYDILEKQAYNKKIDFKTYMNAGTFMLFAHSDLIDWKSFLVELEKNFERKAKINPFRFSLNKMKETLLAGNTFLFISGAPNFTLDIYLA